MALPFFGIGMKTDISSPVSTAESSKFAGILSSTLSQHHLFICTLFRIPAKEQFERFNWLEEGKDAGWLVY